MLYEGVSVAHPKARNSSLAPALDAAGEVVTQHLKAITSIRDSLIKFGDLSCAASLMDDLVQDQKFPTDYASLKGTIEECSKAPKIDLITRDMLVPLLEEITEFQYAAFMINPDNHAFESYEKAISFGNSGKLIAFLVKTEISEKDKSDIRSHIDFIVKHLVLALSILEALHSKRLPKFNLSSAPGVKSGLKSPGDRSFWGRVCMRLSTRSKLDAPRLTKPRPDLHGAFIDWPH